MEPVPRRVASTSCLVGHAREGFLQRRLGIRQEIRAIAEGCSRRSAERLHKNIRFRHRLKLAQGRKLTDALAHEVIACDLIGAEGCVQNKDVK